MKLEWSPCPPDRDPGSTSIGLRCLIGGEIREWRGASAPVDSPVYQPGPAGLGDRDEVVAQGAAEVKDVNDSMGTEIPNHRTVAGLLLDELERIPAQGESHSAHGVSFELVEATDRAIVKVRIRRQKPPIGPDGEPDGTPPVSES